MALVNGGFLHYMDMKKKFIKNVLLWNRRSDFKIILQEFYLCDPFQIVFMKLWSSLNMALVNGGFLHYKDMKKFLKMFFSETAGQILK